MFISNIFKTSGCTETENQPDEFRWICLWKYFWLEKYKKVIDISAYIYYSVFSTGIKHILLINYSFVFLTSSPPRWIWRILGWSSITWLINLITSSCDSTVYK